MTTTADQAPRSCYSTLDNEHDQIRLLSFFNHHSSNICLRLETFDISGSHTCPLYDALSYVWGQADTSTDRHILLNNEPFVVRSNLYQALLALQRCSREGAVQYLWVDALCIDQCNVLERNHQVQMMGRIYSQAFQVRVWLGNELESALRILGSEPKLHMSSFSSFAQASYWKRLWAVQEFELAQKVTFMAGFVTVDLDKLIYKCEQFKSDPRVGSAFGAGLLTTKYLEDHIAGRLLFRREASGRVHLRVLLLKYNRLVCEDPRDSVYGLLGLVPLKQRLTIPVDYTLSARRLCELLRARMRIKRWMLNRSLVAAAYAESGEEWPDDDSGNEHFDPRLPGCN